MLKLSSSVSLVWLSRKLEENEDQLQTDLQLAPELTAVVHDQLD